MVVSIPPLLASPGPWELDVSIPARNNTRRRGESGSESGGIRDMYGGIVWGGGYVRTCCCGGMEDNLVLSYLYPSLNFFLM